MNKNYDIKAIREKYDLTQQELADKLEVTRELISRIEGGKTPITKTTKILLDNFIKSNNVSSVTNDDQGTDEQPSTGLNGSDLLRIRTENEMKQNDFADLIKISRSFYGYVERGQRPVSLKTETQVSKLIKAGKLKSGNTRPEDKSELFKSIPFFNINVSAGNVKFLDDGIIEGAEPDDQMFIPKNIDADIAFPTYGNSMYPDINNGDWVAYKFIKDWSFFNYGMKYLIVTSEQRLLKYIKKHPKDGYLLLESRNPDYEPIDMPVKSIRYILQVRYIGKVEM